MIKDCNIYVNFSNVELPARVRRALHYYAMQLDYSYIKRNNWTGLGPRRKKLTRIIERANRLANYNAALATPVGSHYSMFEGKIGTKRKLFLIIHSPDEEN